MWGSLTERWGYPQQLQTKGNTMSEAIIKHLGLYANGKIVPICGECEKALTPDELGYGHDCEAK
jgi:hypothetical protein